MYIGLTNNLKRRHLDYMSASRNPKNRDYNLPIHKAIRKYGFENFELNILEDNIESLDKLKEREQYWIQYYNTYELREHYNETPGGDAPGKNTVHIGEEHGKAVLTEKQVEHCRQCYKEGKRSRDIFNELGVEKDISYSGFLNMWHGRTWKHVMPEVFEHNPHRAKYGAADRDIIVELFKKSGLTLKAFQRSDECYVGYGTLWKMVNTPEFYDGK